MTNPHNPHRAPIAGAILLLSLAAALTGCKATSAVDPDAAHARAYPFDASHSVVADIQVFRDGVRLGLTNTTDNNLAPGTLWLNQRYSHPVDPIGSGQSASLDLRKFVDEFGDPFRAGGFFATKPPDKVVLVEHEPDEGPILGFIVVGNKMN